MKILKIFANQYLWLALIIFLGLFVRLYKIDSPIADWHSWRQVDTAAVTRNFTKEGFNPFLPKYDDMTAISEKPIVNTLRFRFVEFPIYNIAVYPFYLIFGVLEKISRLVSVAFSLGSIIFLYLITKKYTSIAIALTSALTFVLLPYNIFFSRTTLPEPTFVFFALGMVYFTDRWIWKSTSWRMGIWAFIFTALAFLIKPWAAFYFLPLLYSVYKNTGRIWPLPKRFILFAFAAITPFILWRLWILQQPQGIPASSWLLNGDGIRFRPAFWWWIVSERLGREILGVTGLVLFFIGLIQKPKNSSPRGAGNYFLHFWALSLFLFFIIFATGNVRHDYYQILFVPIAAIFLAYGFISLISGSNLYVPRVWTILLALLLFPLTLYFGWKQVSGLYQINNPVIVEAGKRADQILPKKAMVLAPYNGDTAFLYHINRPGFPVVPLSIKEVVADFGITHFVSVSRDDKTNWVIRHFKVLEDNPKFVIADLTEIKKPFDDILDPEP